MSNLTIAYIQWSGKILKFLRSMTRVTSRLKSWSGFNDKVDPMTMDRKLPVVGQPSVTVSTGYLRQDLNVVRFQHP
jgi:hypothetical protein